jgi:hypothetical protein
MPTINSFAAMKRAREFSLLITIIFVSSCVTTVRMDYLSCDNVSWYEFDGTGKPSEIGAVLLWYCTDEFRHRSFIEDDFMRSLGKYDIKGMPSSLKFGNRDYQLHELINIARSNELDHIVVFGSYYDIIQNSRIISEIEYPPQFYIPPFTEKWGKFRSAVIFIDVDKLVVDYMLTHIYGPIDCKNPSLGSSFQPAPKYASDLFREREWIDRGINIAKVISYRNAEYYKQKT